MLKNMAIHELAVLATYYGVTVENIESVEPDVEYSEMLTLKGPSGKEFTDFAKIGFTIKTKDGKSVTVRADRCGSTTGGGSEAVVAVDGVEKFKSLTPEPALQKLLFSGRVLAVLVDCAPCVGAAVVSRRRWQRRNWPLKQRLTRSLRARLSRLGVCPRGRT